MTTKEEIIKREKNAEFSCYIKRPFVAERGEGHYLYDSEGKRYLDCVMGHGVAGLGHCHPKLVRAIEEQVKKLISCPEVFPLQLRVEFEELLLSIAPGERLKKGKVFLCNSGTESVEGAIKLARLNTKRKGFICTMNAFHGRSIGALSLTFNPKYREPFEPLLSTIKRVRFGDAQAVESAIDQETAGVIVEPIQGEGGVRVAPNGYLQALREICNRKGVLLIFDEVQTGFGRTGKMFACEHWGVSPDILCLAKTIAGGFPCGAIIARDGLDFAPLQHGSTFGGNPLACAAGLATIKTIKEEHLCENAFSVGSYFISRLNEVKSKVPIIREVRGMGLMIAIELKKPSRDYILKLMDHGVLALPAGDMVVRFLPPLSFTKEHVDEVIIALEKALQ
ncbi:MAG: aspartate aminotransferase family protein [Candidatus Anstonellales archaeon]